LRPHYGRLLDLEGRNSGGYNVRFMLKTSYAGCPNKILNKIWTAYLHNNLQPLV